MSRELKPTYMSDQVWAAFSTPKTIKVVKVIDEDGKEYRLKAGFKLVTDELKDELDYYYPAYRTKEKA